MIPTRVNAVTDYVVPTLIAALLRRRRGATRRIMQIGSVWHFAYSILTRYAGGLVPRLSMRAHLACDAVVVLSFVGAAALLREEWAGDRLLLAALGLSDLALIAASDPSVPSEVRTRRAWRDGRPAQPR